MINRSRKETERQKRIRQRVREGSATEKEKAFIARKKQFCQRYYYAVRKPKYEAKEKKKAQTKL